MSKFEIGVVKSTKLKKDWWRKYLDKKKFTPPPKGEFAKSWTMVPFCHWDFDQPTTDRPICSHFSCGRTLTLQESLHGLLCLKHQPERPIYPATTPPIYNQDRTL